MGVKLMSKVLAGRYELLEKIGQGGMAVVYKARCRLLNRFVAIKILKPEFVKDAKFIESFRRESQAAASLSHPNIVNIFDVGKEGNIYYIVMELIEGHVLSDIIKKEGPLDYRRAIDITKQIALALSHAHKNHIIHRDVKSHNIMITNDGVAKITDFGIAKAVNTATIVGNTGTIMGSVHYFSPEQARGGYVDEKSDIYSLGIVLYELLTGKVPFDGDNPVTVALMHLNDEITPPSKFVQGIPPGLDAIVMKATSKYQINRYKTAYDMYEALNTANLSHEGNFGYYYSNGNGNEYSNGNGYSNGDGLDATRVMAAVNGNVKTPLSQESIQEDGENSMNNNGKGKKQRKTKINKVKIFAIILALLLAIPASSFILSAVEGFTAEKEVIIPNLVGSTLEKATADLEELNLGIEVDAMVNSSEFEEGQIVSHDPKEGMTVKEGFTVKVTISKGASQGLIPNLVNGTVSNAEFMLKNYGFELGQVSSDHSDLPKDIVIRQTPEAGTSAEPGTQVNIVVSLGKAVEQVRMPNLMGQEIGAATAALEREGLTMGAVDHEKSSAYAQNTVMWQQYEPGTMIDKNTPVNLKVSTGDESAGPKSIALTIDYEKAQNAVFYLTVVISDESGVRTVINREQRIKEDLSEIVSLSGEGIATVTVFFDSEMVMERNVNFDTGEIS
jgi:serine/threonine protein kinase